MERDLLRSFAPDRRRDIGDHPGMILGVLQFGPALSFRHGIPARIERAGRGKGAGARFFGTETLAGCHETLRYSRHLTMASAPLLTPM